jgi:GNAT superfamily N-acetyltransferase
MANPFDQFDAAPNGPVFGPAPKAAPAPSAAELERLEIARRADARAQESHDRSMAQGGTGAGGKTTEGERKADSFYGRAVGANQNFVAVEDIGPRSLAGQALADTVPGVLNSLPGWVGNSEDRQLADQAQREFIAAVLRLDSGAAIPPEEFVTNAQIYFPQPGDGEAVIKQKADARQRAIDGLRSMAGAAFSGDDRSPATPAAAATGSGSGEEWTREKSIALHGREYVGEDGLPLGPNGGYAKDVETGEWALTGSTITDDRPQGMVPASSIGPDGRPRITGNDPGYMQIAAGLGDVVQGGLNNTIGLLANPVNTNLFRSLGYDGFTSDIGASAREGLGLPYGNETIGAVGQAVTGGLSGAGAARGGASLLGQGLARTSLAEYGATPMLDMATGGSAAASGELARQAGAGPVVQTLATLAGGAAPTAVAKPGSLASLFTMSPRTPPDFDPSVVQAGQRQSVPIRMGDAVPSARGEVANLETTPRGGPVIQQGRRADNERIEQRVSEIGGEGNPSDQFSLGTQVQGAGERYITRTRGEKNARYRRAEQLAGDSRVVPARAIAEVDRQIAELTAQGANNNAATISYLKGLRDDLTAASPTRNVSLRPDGKKHRIEEGGEDVGFLMLQPGNQGEQLPFVGISGVDPGKRGQGIGSAAYDRLAEQVPDLAPSPLGLSEPAQRLWEKRIAAMPPEQAAAALARSRQMGLELGESAEDIDRRLAPLHAAIGRGGQPRGFSITEFQGLRSGAGKKIRGDQALTVTDADRRLGEVMREFSADASEQLPDAAASALQDADKFYGQRQTFINGVLRNLMGTNGRPLPAETAAQRLVAMTKGKGDFNRFSQMWGELNPEEQSDVAATVALSLGRKANGDFSPATLIGSLDPRTGINPRTARLIFGEDGAKALEDLRVIAQAKTGQAAQLNNSRTGNMVNRAVGGLKTLVTSLIGYSAGGATGAVALPMARSFFSQWGEEKAARALMNPDFTRWLRNAPDTSNPAALNAYFKRLEIAAAKSPILAHDIQGFREAVNDTLAQSPGSLAAAEQEQN